MRTVVLLALKMRTMVLLVLKMRTVVLLALTMRNEDSGTPASNNEGKTLGHFTKNYRTFYPKNCIQLSKIWVWDPGFRKKPIRIPEPGAKKTQDPGSATLLPTLRY
jgi:hypothetical protein